MGQSFASFVAPVGPEKYDVFLICSQEKHLHFQEKVRRSQEKILLGLGEMCMNPVMTLPLYCLKQFLFLFHCLICTHYF